MALMLRVRHQSAHFVDLPDAPAGWDFFRLLAIGSCTVSLGTVLFLAISVPLMYAQIGTERATIEAKSAKFKEASNRIWHRIHPIEEGEEPRRIKRSSAVASPCACTTLNCAQGPAGPAGPPGQDNPPGQPGNPGQPGEDGMDILMESELDMPCIVCPGGPLGQRGYQGERGAPGTAGMPGSEGISGKEGGQGAEGLRGPPGLAGPKGEPGHPGAPGGQVVAGVGVKGPKGISGPAGPLGSPGLPGRRSMASGVNGPTGEQGAPGEVGEAGKPGEFGEEGPSGEPGMPSAYCPSDCGVTHIKVPEFDMRSMGESAESDAQEEYGTAQMPKDEQLTKKERRRAKADYRSHPAGGYYRHRLEGGGS